MSALATLTASEESMRKAFFLGIQWGVGHSTGLIVVGSILIALSSTEDTIEVPQNLTIFFESLVGIFMLGLGVYGILRALRKKSGGDDDDANNDYTEDEPLNHQRDDVEHMAAGAEASLSMADVGDVSAPISQGAAAASIPHTTSMTMSDDESLEQEVAKYKSSLDASMHRLAANEASSSSLVRDAQRRKKRSMCKNCSTGVLALAAGLVHGLAGPGGVLGVIPAVQVRDPLLGSLYLGTFCITSTLTMGCFATVYGKVSNKLGQSSATWEFRIECASASLSILVGVMWLALLATGKLEDVFG